MNTAFLHGLPGAEFIEYDMPTQLLDPTDIHQMEGFQDFRVKIKFKDACVDNFCASGVNINDPSLPAQRLEDVTLPNLCPSCVDSMSSEI